MSLIYPPSGPTGPNPPNRRGSGPSFDQIRKAADEVRSKYFDYIERVAQPGKIFDVVNDVKDIEPPVIGQFVVKEVRQSNRISLSDDDAKYIKDFISRNRTPLGQPYSIKTGIEVIAEKPENERSREGSEIRDVVAPIIHGTLTLSSGRSHEVGIQAFTPPDENEIANLLRSPDAEPYKPNHICISSCELTDNSLLGPNEDLVRDFVEQFGKDFILIGAS